MPVQGDGMDIVRAFITNLLLDTCCVQEVTGEVCTVCENPRVSMKGGFQYNTNSPTQDSPWSWGGESHISPPP